MQYSIGVSPEGRLLFEKCVAHGFHQCVDQPTRGEYLLDLVLTDVEELISSKVLPKVADHNLTLTKICAKISEHGTGSREVWEYTNADWKSMENEIIQVEWESMLPKDCPESMVNIFTDLLMALVRKRKT